VDITTSTLFSEKVSRLIHCAPYMCICFVLFDTDTLTRVVLCVILGSCPENSSSCCCLCSAVLLQLLLSQLVLPLQSVLDCLTHCQQRC
jgi:hypothetical protein